MSVPLLDEPLSATLLALVEDRAGLLIRNSRRRDFDAAVARHATLACIPVDAHYVERLRSDARLFDDLVDELVICETYFFRDSAQLDELARRIVSETLPRLAPFDPVRIWSAGCASGEEAYTLAMLLDELGIGARARVVGSDISRRALARAAAATYGAWSLRGVSEARLARFFDAGETTITPKEHVRRRVSFARHNLMDSLAPSLEGSGKYDVILCRNAILYFSGDTARDVSRGLMRALVPGGLLMLGPSDPMLPTEDVHEILTTSAGVLYRKRIEGVARAAVPATPVPVLVARLELPREEPVQRTERAQLPEELLQRARTAFDAGDYYDARRLARDLTGDPRACSILLRAEANLRGPASALTLAEPLLVRHPSSADLHAVHATLLMDAGRDDAAFRAARNAVYLDGKEPLGHALVGALLSRRGDHEGAERAFERARALAGGGES